MDGLPGRVAAALVDQLFRASRADRWDLSRDAFASAIEECVQGSFGDQPASADAVRELVERLHVEDLALARACMAGSDAAWQHFMLEQRPGLYRCADALDPSGEARELADALYADLHGATRERGQPLLRYFHGRSRLSTWLRTVLAQRHVDAIRARRRTEPLEDEAPAAARGAVPDPDRDLLLPLVERALRTAIADLPAKDRLRLRSYHVSGLTLAQIGTLTREHEATVSRQLARTRREVRAAATAWMQAQGHLSDAATARAFELAIEDPGELSLLRIFGPDQPEKS